MDIFLKHTFLGEVFPRNFFPGNVFLVDVFLSDAFEVPLEGTSFSGPFLGDVFGVPFGCSLRIF